jgi:isoleucyl-tRNA synthetase
MSGCLARTAFKNVITTGTLAGNDGRKMSKSSFGNYTDPNELMDQYSADALRFLLLLAAVERRRFLSAGQRSGRRAAQAGHGLEHVRLLYAVRRC